MGRTQSRSYRVVFTPNYLARERTRRPWWVAVTAVVALSALAAWLISANL